MPRSSGLFITLEGGEGAGKSTQAPLLDRRLRDLGYETYLVHEPGTTALGAYLRTWLKGDQPTAPVAELLLFEAARAQLVQDVIRPAIERGAIVISDRFTDSTLAYQGYGRDLDVDMIRSLNRFATGGLAPDKTILLDLPVARGLERLTPLQAGLFDDDAAQTPPRRVDDEGSRRFEKLSPRFHEAVRRGFHELASLEPDRWTVVDASQDVEAVSEVIWNAVCPLLPSRPS